MLLSRFNDKQVVNGSIIFSILDYVSRIVAMGGVLTQFEIIPHCQTMAFVYEWQLLRARYGYGTTHAHGWVLLYTNCSSGALSGMHKSTIQ